MKKNRTKNINIFRNNTTIVSSVTTTPDGEYGTAKLNIFDDKGQFFTFTDSLAPDYDRNTKIIAEVKSFLKVLDDFVGDLEKANTIITKAVDKRNIKNADHQKKSLAKINAEGYSSDKSEFLGCPCGGVINTVQPNDGDDDATTLCDDCGDNRYKEEVFWCKRDEKNICADCLHDYCIDYSYTTRTSCKMCNILD